MPATRVFRTSQALIGNIVPTSACSARFRISIAVAKSSSAIPRLKTRIRCWSDVLAPFLWKHRGTLRRCHDHGGRKGQHIDDHHGIGDGRQLGNAVRTPFAAKVELALVEGHAGRLRNMDQGGSLPVLGAHLRPFCIIDRSWACQS